MSRLKSTLCIIPFPSFPFLSLEPIKKHSPFFIFLLLVLQQEGEGGDELYVDRELMERIRR